MTQADSSGSTRTTSGRGDATIYGGSGWGNLGGIEPLLISVHGRPYALSLTLPPLACVFLKNEPASKGD